MAFLVKGGITLDGVQFNTDPATYEPVNWEKRYSKFAAIGGAMTIQDFGVFKKDNTLRLQSGDQNPLEESVVVALHTRFRTRGVTYALTDWLGNSFTVFIEKFVPVPLIQGLDGSVVGGGTLRLYSYSMDLHVLNIVNLYGVAFVGA
jgi:hypothetical protein